MKRKPVLLYIYNSFNDPLFQNILLSYIREIQATSKDFRFHVITFEQEDFAITKTERKKIKEQLAANEIYWYPLEYHSGSFKLVKKGWDMMASFLRVAYLRAFKGTKLIFAFTNTSAAFSYLFSRVLGMKLMIYSYEPQSEFMEELGLWSKNSLQYKLLKPLEEIAGQRADVVMTGTKHMVERLKNDHAKGKVLRAPTAVDEHVFYHRDDEAEKLRAQMEIGDRHVVLYIGKFGDLYYKEETIAFFSGMYEKNSNLFFIVCTRYPHEEIKSWFRKYGIPRSNYRVTGFLSNREVIEHISSADIAISAVPPSPSQKFRSPTKVGEYLMCGVPFITCRGVSEDDWYAEHYEVGVVVNEFSKHEAIVHYDQIDKLLKEDKVHLRERCRKVGIDYRSKYKLVEMIRENLYALTN